MAGNSSGMIASTTHDPNAILDLNLRSRIRSCPGCCKIVRRIEDLERIRLLFSDLEAQADVIELLTRAEGGEGVRIFIGSENKLFSMSGSSMIAAPFRDASQKIVGVIGVIGPTRLNYARIVPMVDYTAKVVSRILEGGR